MENYATETERESLERDEKNGLDLKEGEYEVEERGVGGGGIRGAGSKEKENRIIQ